VNASVQSAISSPDDATRYERTRDMILRFFVRNNGFFTGLAGVMAVIFLINLCVLIFAAFGAVFGVGVVGRNPACDVTGLANVTFAGNNQYPPKVNGHFVADYCNLSQRIFNVCTKVIVIILTYINTLPFAWRVAIMVDALAEVAEQYSGIDLDKREAGIGLDFYGRPTEAMWFHIDKGRRAVIALLLCLAVIFQVLNLVFAIIYWGYLKSQTWPGVFLINAPAFLSIVSQVSAALIQGAAEKALVEANPSKFPAPVATYLQQGWSDWRAGRSGKNLWRTLKDKLAEHNEKEGSKGGSVLALTGIDVTQSKAKRSSCFTFFGC